MKKVTFLILILFNINLWAQEQPDTVYVLKSFTVKGVRADPKTPITQKTIDKKFIERNYFGQEIPILLNTTPSIN